MFDTLFNAVISRIIESGPVGLVAALSLLLNVFLGRFVLKLLDRLFLEMENRRKDALVTHDSVRDATEAIKKTSDDRQLLLQGVAAVAEAARVLNEKVRGASAGRNNRGHTDG